MDIIKINELKIETIIGVSAWEKQLKQTVIVDLELFTSIEKAIQTDNITETINYAKISEDIIRFVNASTFNLIETLAENIATLILNNYAVKGLKLTLVKPGAIPQAKSVAICIERNRAEI